jgi:hypothetical protein
MNTCTKDCRPEFDEHCEACIKAFIRVFRCQYCCFGDNCMVCGRHERVLSTISS